MYARNPNRYVAPAQKPEPKPLSLISRPQLAARVHQLRQALDLLWSQSETDGCEPFSCVGRCKIELIDLEERLREMDRQAERGEPMPLPVALAAVMQSVRQEA
jgi:hypothetical protein